MVSTVAVSVGQRFGRWTALTEARRLPGYKKDTALLRCDCGSEREVYVYDVKRGKSTHCRGCNSATHRRSKTPEYKAWNAMLHRCYDSNSISWKRYGGRGVTVCDRWNPAKGGSFENFLADMGLRPSPDHELDKEAVDKTNKVYCPELCRWVHRIDNANRKCTTVYLTYRGKSQSVSKWARELGIGRTTINMRLASGWSVEKALSTQEDSRYRPITYNGETLSVTEWARRLNTTADTLCNRLKLGWSIERALTTPVKTRKRRAKSPRPSLSLSDPVG